MIRNIGQDLLVLSKYLNMACSQRRKAQTAHGMEEIVELLYLIWALQSYRYRL
jgi:hypothetical protein